MRSSIFVALALYLAGVVEAAPLPHLPRDDFREGYAGDMDGYMVDDIPFHHYHHHHHSRPHHYGHYYSDFDGQEDHRFADEDRIPFTASSAYPDTESRDAVEGTVRDPHEARGLGAFMTALTPALVGVAGDVGSAEVRMNPKPAPAPADTATAPATAPVDRRQVEDRLFLRELAAELDQRGSLDLSERDLWATLQQRGIGNFLTNVIPAVIGAAGGLGSAYIFTNPKPAPAAARRGWSEAVVRREPEQAVARSLVVKRDGQEDALEARGIGNFLTNVIPAVIGAAGGLGSAYIFTNPSPAPAAAARREWSEDLLHRELGDIATRSLDELD
ncbi:hypothetical protein EIP91_002511 [Steccherinum ochraceum]|uniref:Uncharacterized protein n=1 Tax=Steccherinum ochraceum TaxID=92696 RepID=A0A4V2MWA5_9APHY|nr:hypothetical protein EIP91_002511 [Steccherinum ochraceum]